MTTPQGMSSTDDELQQALSKMLNRHEQQRKSGSFTAYQLRNKTEEALLQLITAHKEQWQREARINEKQHAIELIYGMEKGQMAIDQLNDEIDELKKEQQS